MLIHFSSGISFLIFFFFSSLLSCKRLVFRGLSVNGDAIRTIGGGGDGLNDVVGRSLSIDGGDGEISINSFGEFIGYKIRVCFSSFIGFVRIVIGFCFGINFFLITFDVWGFLFGSFLIITVDWEIFSCCIETDCVYDVDGR